MSFSPGYEPRNSDMIATVPTFFEKVLQMALPHRLREEAMGDLEEEFHWRIDEGANISSIRWWYRVQVLKTLAVFMWQEKGGFMAFFWSLVFFFFLVVLAFVVDFSDLTFNFPTLLYVIDIPSFVIVLPPAIFFGIATTSKDAFQLSWKLAFSDQMEVELERVKDACRFLHITGNLTLTIGWLGTIVGWIILLQNLDWINEPETIGPANAIAIITLFYGLCFKMCLHAAEFKIRGKYLEN